MDQPRSRPVPSTAYDMNSPGRGLGWHGPIPVVGAPPSSECYASSRRHRVAGSSVQVWCPARPTRFARGCPGLARPGVGTTTSRGRATARRSNDLLGRDPPAPTTLGLGITWTAVGCDGTAPSPSLELLAVASAMPSSLLLGAEAVSSQRGAPYLDRASHGRGTPTRPTLLLGQAPGVWGRGIPNAAHPTTRTGS
jgi:hypothetical protein